MSREEAISFLQIDKLYQDIKDYRDALDMAIKALEQEPMLDKIRTDIGRALSEEVLDDNRHLISDIGIGLEIALRIIDKYKAESEDD